MAIQSGQLPRFAQTARPQRTGVHFGAKGASTETPAELDRAEFRKQFAEAIRQHSVRIKPTDVVPRGPQYHMWLLPNGELRQIPDMQHDQMAKQLFQKLRLQGSRFIDEDESRSRERAVVDGGLAKVCSHDRQLQICIPTDVTDAQMRVIYSLTRSHANEKFVWDIRGASGQSLHSGEEATPLGWRMFRQDFQKVLQS